MEKFEELEKRIGLFAIDISKWPEEITEAEFRAKSAGNYSEFVGVAYEDRVKFLQDNDYGVTRENLLDSSLSARQVE